MVRLARYDVPDIPRHVIQRGNNRGVTFVADEDYVFYLECLEEASMRSGCAVHAYVLMTNHVHLLVTPDSADGLGRMMQSVGRRYVRHFNHVQQRTGTLWEGRYRATLVEADSYFLACCRYIEMNPVRAGMTAAPGDYRWSSWRAHAEGVVSTLLSDHPQYATLGADPAERRAAYRALFAAVLDDDTVTATAIRDGTNKAWALGGERFKAELAALTERRLAPAPKGRPRKVENAA
jgi:putative transposase